MGQASRTGTLPPPAGHSLRLRDVQATEAPASQRANPAGVSSCVSVRSYSFEVSRGWAAALEMPSEAANSLAFPKSCP